jgi:hypothetical protein
MMLLAIVLSEVEKLRVLSGALKWSGCLALELFAVMSVDGLLAFLFHRPVVVSLMWFQACPVVPPQPFVLVVSFVESTWRDQSMNESVESDDRPHTRTRRMKSATRSHHVILFASISIESNGSRHAIHESPLPTIVYRIMDSAFVQWSERTLAVARRRVITNIDSS